MAAAWCNSFYLQVFLLVPVLGPIIIRDGGIQVLEMISYWRIARGQFVHPSCSFMSCWLRHRQQEQQQQHGGKDKSLWQPRYGGGHRHGKWREGPQQSLGH